MDDLNDLNMSMNIVKFDTCKNVYFSHLYMIYITMSTEPDWFYGKCKFLHTMYSLDS